MLKYYLRGLGIGIIVTTLILTVVFNLKGKLSDSQIKERAEKLGMVMAEPTEDSIFDKPTTDNESETADKPTDDNTLPDSETTKAEEDEGPSSEEPASEPATEEPATEPAAEAPTTEAPTEASVPEPPAPVVNSVSIEIRSGMYSEAVSRLLFESGIIPNAAEFNRYLENNGYAGKIAVGTFTVSPDMSYEQLAWIITRS